MKLVKREKIDLSDNTKLQVFINEEFNANIRVVEIDGQPFFVAKDVCESFGDTNYRRSVARLEDDEKGIASIDTLGGKQQMSVVNEAGLYTLLFNMQPQKAKGVSQNNTLIDERVAKLKQFKRWVTSEVLPSIRKHGIYATENVIDQITDNPDFAINLLQKLKDERNNCQRRLYR